jgi:hypothetical protein
MHRFLIIGMVSAPGSYHGRLRVSRGINIGTPAIFQGGDKCNAGWKAVGWLFREGARQRLRDWRRDRWIDVTWRWQIAGKLLGQDRIGCLTFEGQNPGEELISGHRKTIEITRRLGASACLFRCRIFRRPNQGAREDFRNAKISQVERLLME